MQARRDGEEAPDQQPPDQAKIFVHASSNWISQLEHTGDAPAPRLHRRAKLVVTSLGVLALSVVVAAFLYPFGTPTAGPTTSATTSATTTQPTESTTETPASSSSAGNGPLPTPPTSTVPSSKRQDGTATTTTPTPSGSGQGEDADRYQNVQEKRVVELVPQERYNWVDIEYWRHDTAAPGEVQMDGTGVHTAVGAQLAVIADTPLAGRDRCSKVTAWRDRVEFGELHAGSQLCGRSRAGRYASLEVRTLPSSPSSDGRFIFYGITWN